MDSDCRCSLERTQEPSEASQGCQASWKERELLPPSWERWARDGKKGYFNSRDLNEGTRWRTALTLRTRSVITSLQELAPTNRRLVGSRCQKSNDSVILLPTHPPQVNSWLMSFHFPSVTHYPFSSICYYVFASLFNVRPCFQNFSSRNMEDCVCFVEPERGY